MTMLGPLGCSQVRNPATGELQYTSLSPEDEKKLGRQEDPKAVAEFGGRYQDKALQAYVAKVGNRVKGASELAGQPFTFTLLDSDKVTLSVRVPETKAVSAGSVALASVELMSTTSAAVLTTFQKLSTALTVMLKAVPAVLELGVPVLPLALPGAAVSPGTSS